MGKGNGDFKSTKPSMTVQSFRDEADLGQRITSMMRGARPDPRIPVAARFGLYQGPGSVPPIFRDFDVASMPKSYHEMMIFIQKSQRFFDSLPLPVKKAFDFQPESFFDALRNPAQQKLLIDLGVLKPVEAAVTPKSGGAAAAGAAAVAAEEPPPAKGGGGGSK